MNTGESQQGLEQETQINFINCHIMERKCYGAVKTFGTNFGNDIQINV